MNPIQQARLRNHQTFKAGYISSASITRPANTTTYGANDVVGGAGVLVLTSISNANPAVATLNSHGLLDGTAIRFTTDGTLPAGLTVGTTYYVVNKAANTFQVSLTSGGAAVATTDAGSGNHTANVVGSGVLTFSGMSAGGDVAAIRQTVLSLNLASVPANMAGMRLHLYSASPPSDLVDNDVWALSAADLAVYLGYIDLGTPVDVGPVLVVCANNVDRVFVAPTDVLYGYLVTAGNYAPASGTVATVKLVATGL